MDTKNVLMAIVLSTLVLVFWATFFEPPPVERQIVEDQIVKKEESSSPSIEKDKSSKKITRNEAIDYASRIKIENNKNDPVDADFFNEKIVVDNSDYYFSNVIARASKTMTDCHNEKIKLKNIGTNG